MSYLTVGHLCEYFSQTYVIVDNELKYLRGVEHLSENEVELNLYQLEGDSVLSRNVTFPYEGYEDFIKNNIKVFLPPSQFLKDQGTGETFFLSLTKPNHYKRSMDSNRYVRVSMTARNNGLRINPNSIRVESILKCDFDAKQSFEAALESGNSMELLDKEFALVSGVRKMLVYLNNPIGYINNNGGVKLHPKYIEHFGCRVRSLVGGYYAS